MDENKIIRSLEYRAGTDCEDEEKIWLLFPCTRDKHTEAKRRRDQQLDNTKRRL